MEHWNVWGALGLCIGAGVAGCVEDQVAPSCYGAREFASSEMPDAHGAGAGGGGGGGAAGGVSDPNGMDGQPQAGTGGEASAVDAGPPPEAGDPCDLRGRWLATMHSVTDAIGQQQVAHRWLYYEIGATAAGFEITKGLMCGDDAVGVGAFAVTADFRSSWDASTAKVDASNRSVSSVASAEGCNVHFGKWYVVQGATNPHYTDPNVALPTVDQPANGSTPGWEDWDEDGQPGITSVVSGVVAGKIFVAPRTWSELSGTVPNTTGLLRLPMQWDQETNLLAYEGTPLLTSQAVRAADPKLHFAELARLAPAQATGDDMAICAAVRELADTLTPAAAAN